MIGLAVLGCLGALAGASEREPGTALAGLTLVAVAVGRAR